MRLNDDIARREEFGAIRCQAGSFFLIGSIMKASLFSCAALHHYFEPHLGQGRQDRWHQSNPALFQIRLGRYSNKHIIPEMTWGVWSETLMSAKPQ